MTICSYQSCKKSASYGTEYKNPIHCASHKEEGEENVKHKRCEEYECKKLASYGPEGSSAIHCKEHREDDEIDTRHKKCPVQGCHNRPLYGPVGGKPKHCRDHKQEDEVDVVNKRCRHLDCDKRPSYGPRKGVMLHCFDHRVRGEINVKHKRCAHSGCNTIASYGTVWEKPIHCMDHKTGREFDVHNKKCRHPHCDKRPIYGKRKGKPLHCSAHKKSTEFDVNSVRCKGCGLYTVNKQPYLCSYCSPDSSKLKKTKEMKVVKFFEEQEMKFLHNKSVGAACGSYRPDLLFDAGTHFIVIEVDEEQHRSITFNDRYGNICERVRENNIFIALGLPTVFIRYNPDSCRINGELVRTSTKKRLQTLLEKVEHHITTIPTKPITAEFLFYDDYEKRTQKYQSVDMKQLAKFQRKLGL